MKTATLNNIIIKALIRERTQAVATLNTIRIQEERAVLDLPELSESEGDIAWSTAMALGEASQARRALEYIRDGFWAEGEEVPLELENAIKVATEEGL